MELMSDLEPVQVATRSKVWVCDRSPGEIVSSIPTGGMDVCLLRRADFSHRGVYWLWCVVVCDPETDHWGLLRQ